MNNTHNIARRVRFSPYRKGAGPTFTLQITDDHGWDDAGRIRLGYVLKMHDAGKTTVLFRGADVCAHVASDSDAAVAAVMTFLTLKPGDTDADYFAAYTDEQHAFCSAHAESLSLEVLNRFGE